MKHKRNLTLDIIRGFLLVIMTIDHFSNQIILSYISYFSAAEGFVFLSGIVMGIYGIKKYKSDGFKQLKSKLINRSLQIYKYHLFTVLFYFAFKALLNASKTWFPLSIITAFNYRYFFWSLLLIFKPYGLDILPMYIFLVAIAPFIIHFIVKDKMKLILTFSIILWLLNSIFIDSTLTLFFHDFRSGAFSVFSWQLLFILGISIAYLVNSGHIYELLNKKFSIITSVIIFILFFLLKTKWSGVIDNNLMNKLTMRSTLGPLRLINFFSVAHIVYYFCKKIKFNAIFSLVALLGRYSIQVFTFHLLLFIIFREYLPIFSIQFISKTNYFHFVLNNILNWIITIPIILLLFIPPIFINRKTSLSKLLTKGYY